MKPVKTLPPKREHRAESGGAGGRPTHRTLYGINPISEALDAGRAIVEAVVLPGKHGPELAALVKKLRERSVRIVDGDRHRIATLADSRNHQGVVAQVEALPNGSLTGLVKDRPAGALTVLLIDHLQDPQNLGSIYRSADAFAVDLMFLPAHESVSHQLGSVSKASAGAVEHVPTVVVRDLAKAVSELKGHGFRLVGLSSPDTGVPATPDLGAALAAERLAIALGAEGAGLSKTVRALCDELVSIATTGKVGSLNAGTACGVVLHERFRASRRA